MVSVRRALWRVAHAPLEVSAMVLNEASSCVDMVCEAVYEKAYPDSGPVDSKDTHLRVTTSSNRSGVVNTLRVGGIDLRREQLDKLMEQHAENAKKQGRKQPW